jgi:hypothetical protein
LLDQGASLGEQWIDVARVLLSNGEITLAMRAARLGVEESRGSLKSQFGLAQILADAGRQDEAKQVVGSIPHGQFPAAQRAHFVGICALEIGDLELARSSFESVVAAVPVSGPSWLSLATLSSPDDEKLLSRLNEASDAIAATPTENRAQWHYAKGTVIDRLERPDQAFPEFEAGASLMRSIRPYDAQADRIEADTIIKDFTGAAIEKLVQRVSVDTSRPVFVVGLPRSGTTLIEHILTSNSEVSGGGEVPFASILTREAGNNSPGAVEQYSQAHGADALARLYLHLGDERFGAGSRFVDKWLGNTRTLGLVASALPQAKIIWLRRNPLDCAWSCFKTYFSQRIDWSWSLEDIATHFQVEDRLYEHWRSALGERLLTVSYEQLVTEPTQQVGRILDHVGLDREAAMDKAHSTKRAVTSASLAQVREPIYRRAVGAAEPYREWLTPFIDAYGDQASSS